MGSSTGVGIFKGIYDASDVDMAKFHLASEYLTQSAAGTQLYQDAAAKQQYLQINHEGKVSYEYNPNTGVGIVSWDPDKAIEVKDTNGNVIGYESPAANLAHEMAHLADENYVNNTKVALPGYDSLAEKVAIDRTNAIVAPLGEAERIAHDGGFVVVPNPTMHSNNNQWAEVNANGTNESSSNYNDFNNSWDTSTYPSYDSDQPIGDPFYDDGGWNYYGYWAATNESQTVKEAPKELKHTGVSSSGVTELAASTRHAIPANDANESGPLSLSSGLGRASSSISNVHSLVQAMSSFAVSAGAFDSGVMPQAEHMADVLYASNGHHQYMRA